MPPPSPMTYTATMTTTIAMKTTKPTRAALPLEDSIQATVLLQLWIHVLQAPAAAEMNSFTSCGPDFWLSTGEPSTMMRPPEMNVQRSATMLAQTRSWVTTTEVVPRRELIPRMSSAIFLPVSG